MVERLEGLAVGGRAARLASKEVARMVEAGRVWILLELLGPVERWVVAGLKMTVAAWRGVSSSGCAAATPAGRRGRGEAWETHFVVAVCELRAVIAGEEVVWIQSHPRRPLTRY